MKRTVLTGFVMLSAAAVTYGQSFVKNLTGFEAAEGFQTTDEVIWMAPLWSATTVRYANLDPLVEPDGIWAEGDDGFGTPWSESQVVDWGAYAGTQSYVIYFLWGNPADTDDPPGFSGPPSTGGNDFVRCTTWWASSLPRPSVHLDGKIRFKMAVVAYADELYTPIPGGETASILVSLGIRETGNDLAQGAPDFAGGDIEWVYMQGSEVIPAAGTNGLLPQLPNDDPNYPYRTTPPGGKRFNATSTWPPAGGDWYSVEFDLANLAAVRGFANNATAPDTAGDGLLDAATWGVGDGVNRGSIENIAFTNDAIDIYGAFFFIWIDDVVLEAPDPDPPTIRAPVTDADTEVLVDCSIDASLAELFINDIPSGTSVPDGSGLATFSGLTLVVGDVLEATQTVFGKTSGFSPPVIVTSATTPLAENFDAYTSQEELNAVWPNLGTLVGDRGVVLAGGSATSCPNFVVSDYSAGPAGSKIYRTVGAMNGTNDNPLVVTYWFQHRGEPDSYGERSRFELTGSVTGRADGATGFTLSNDGSLPSAYQSNYTILLETHDPQTLNTNGFLTDYFGYEIGLTPIPRVRDVWHKMQIVITADVINYYIDDQPANPVATNGVPLWPGGVPRPSTDPYEHVIVGLGYSNNGPAMMYDNVSITIGGTPLPFGDPVPPAPTVAEPLVPGLTAVTLTDVGTNADLVEVFANAGPTPIGSQTGPFPAGTADVTVSPLNPGDAVTAKQTLGGESSCHSAAVIVADTSLVTEYEIGPTLAGLSRSISASDLINGVIGVLENGDVDTQHGVVAWNMNASTCLEMLNTEPSLGFHPATPGGAAGGLVDLTDGVEGSVLEAVLADYDRASLVVRYDFPVPTTITEIVVFAANEDPGAANNGRLFQHYDVYVSTNGMADFEPLALTVTSGSFGYFNLDDDRATLTRIYDAASPTLAAGVTNVRFVFYCVSNAAGRFHDPWQGNANEDPAYQSACPDTEPEDTDGYRKAFEAPIVKEIDLFGYRPGDGDGDGDVDLDDLANFVNCLTGPDAGPPGAGCEVFDFPPFDNDVDLEDFAGFQLAFTG